MSKTAGTAVEPGRGDRPPRPRRAALFPAPRGRLRGGRQFHLGAVRRALHRRIWPTGSGNLASRSLAMLGQVPGRASCPADRGRRRSTTPGGEARRGLRGGDGRARPPRRRRGGVGAGRRRPTSTSSRWRPGRWPRPAGRRSWTPRWRRWRAALSSGRAGGPVHSRESPSALAVTRPAREADCAAAWDALGAPPVAGLATTKPEVLFPKPASCLEVSLSRSKTI